MKTFTAILLCFASTICIPSSVSGQSQSKPEPQNPDTIVVEKTEVILDAVVRDKKGRPLTNLSAKDFEVYENGELQQISSLRRVVRGSEANINRLSVDPSENKQTAPPTTTSSNATTTARSLPSPADENNLSAVALVFDRLSTNGRARSHAAALAYLAQGFPQNDLVGVFAVNPSLKILQQFTNDKQLIKQAVDKAQSENSATPALFPGQTEVSNLSYLNDLWRKQASLADALYSGRSTNQMADMVALLVLEMSIRTAEVFDGLERDRQGQGTTSALLAIIDAMRKLPGRKAVIFFGESVAVTAKVMPQFRNVISNANRAGVSIYSVDAAGLRTVSSDVEAGQAMTLLGQRRAAIAASKEDITSLNGIGPAGNMEGPMTFDLERNEELVRRNPERILAALADETGGLLISGTNDPGARLRQVNEDLHSYYLLTYSPRDQNYDGAYRRISVRVTRSGADVQARKGYYALRGSYDSPILEYEVPALAVLGGKTVTDAFQTRCAAFSFPEPTRPGLVPVVVEVPAGAINFLVDNAKTKYSSDFSIVVLIRDAAGHVARKLSTHYLLNGPYDKLDAALNGSILFYKETQLQPGRYSVSSIVYDALAKHSSTSAADVIVPAAEKNSLQLSSIMLVKTGEQLSSANNQASRLFRFNELLLYPNLGEPLSKSDDRELTIFLTAYTPDGLATKLSLEIRQNGRTVGQLSYDLPPADQTGRIQYASAIPLEKFQPGNYELKVTLQNAKSRAMNSALFTINP